MSKMDKHNNLWIMNPPGTVPDDLTLTPAIDPTVFTSDNNLIDFVLAYQPLEQSECQKEYQGVFEAKMEARGLQLEREGLDQSQDGKTCFLKIHAPFDLLARTAEIDRVKMPIQRSDLQEEEVETSSYLLQEFFFCGHTPFLVEQDVRAPPAPSFFTLDFTQDHLNYFLNKDTNTFFPMAKRILMVWDILEQIVISTTEIQGSLLKGHRAGQQVGISYLLNRDVYVAAFPLHDGDEPSQPSTNGEKPGFGWPLRAWLYECWARPGRWHCYQPLDQIREYFGEKVAIYFAWLGMYTTLLFPITAFGIFCFIWGLVQMGSSETARDVCDEDGEGGWIMCRSCQSLTCQFIKFKKSCMNAKLYAVFQNNFTILLALSLGLWGVIFLEIWKRKQAELTCRWDTIDMGYEYEPPRPEYQATAKQRRRNPITREWEPYIPARSKIQNIVASLSAVGFLLSMAVAVIIAVIVFKATMVVYFYNHNLPFVDLLGSVTVTSLVGSCINASCIIILEKVYAVLAWWLTEKEYPRTMSSFETSFTYKLYTFQFINYYALLFYLSFVQPSVQAALTPASSPFLNDQCDPVGCSFLVTQQLIVILVIKQAWNNVVEIYLPKLMQYWKTRKNIEATEENVYARYEQDFDLPEPPPLMVLPEYLEMVIQYGIVVLFGAAFPLTPLFALINNIVEIRVDAYKFVAQVRRVVPVRASDIGSWYSIMDFVTRLAILSNALIIALSTDLIDRYIYKMFYSETGDMKGYNDFIMGEFNTKDWSNPELAYSPQFGNVTICRYRGYFEPPDADEPYTLSQAAYVTMLAKTAFVLIFENLIIWIQELIQYVIPDIPQDVQLHIQRNQYIARVAAFYFDKEKQEKKEAQSDEVQFEPDQEEKADAEEKFF